MHMKLTSQFKDSTYYTLGEEGRMTIEEFYDIS